MLRWRRTCAAPALRHSARSLPFLYWYISLFLPDVSPPSCRCRYGVTPPSSVDRVPEYVPTNPFQHLCFALASPCGLFCLNLSMAPPCCADLSHRMTPPSRRHFCCGLPWIGWRPGGVRCIASWLRWRRAGTALAPRRFFAVATPMLRQNPEVAAPLPIAFFMLCPRSRTTDVRNVLEPSCVLTVVPLFLHTH